MAVHTDTLNEAGFVEDTIAAFDGRTIHTYHSEGAGGGHAPDLLKVVGQRNVLPSSTNPTLPCGQNSVAELFDMIMVCHNLNPKIPSDVAFAESRVRAETIVAESVLHDMGAISMIGSDSQAMGRIGESFLRAVQTADAMKKARGALPEDAAGNDNFRVLRYIAKVTINPAIAAGISSVVGSIEPGKFADLVLWEPAFFGAKPKMVLKGGFIAWANMGDPNASLPTPQPMYYRPMFGDLRLDPAEDVDHLRVARRLSTKASASATASSGPSCRCRRRASSASSSMVRNTYLPDIEVDPQTFAVTVDGVHATVKPPKIDRAQPTLFLQLTGGRMRAGGDVDRMIIVHNILGNAADERMARHAWTAPRSTCSPSTNGRRRKAACASAPPATVELALSLDRNTHLHDGDMLVWDEAERRAIVARIALNDVMIVDLGGAEGRGVGRRRAHDLRTRPCAGQPALAGDRQGRPRLRAADRRPQGHDVGDEDACLQPHRL